MISSFSRKKVPQSNDYLWVYLFFHVYFHVFCYIQDKVRVFVYTQEKIADLKEDVYDHTEALAEIEVLLGCSIQSGCLLTDLYL